MLGQVENKFDNSAHIQMIDEGLKGTFGTNTTLPSMMHSKDVIHIGGGSKGM